MAIEGIEVGMRSGTINRPAPTPKVQSNANVNEGSNGSNIQVATQRAITPRGNNDSSYGGQGNEQHSNDDKAIQDVSPEKVKEAIKKVNNKIKPTRTECQFSYHENTKRISIKVIDQDTGDTIKEIPPEKTLDMIARVWEMAGILVDEKR